ncbi:MAG: sigma-54 interaction domain-containing protein [Parashewanella sp.]
MIIGHRKGLLSTMEQAELISKTDSTALILGETGSGKEVIARYIHQQSSRANQSFLRVNCGAISPELIDSELFGHEKGSFTGATSLKKGWFERANGGTLFLDEIGELSLAAQVRLLRVIQEGHLTRVGGEKEITVDVRIIAATHRDLEKLVAAGTFREDLWFRVNVFPIQIPALRNRTEDLEALSRFFAKHSAQKLGVDFVLPTQSQIDYLSMHHWPGNVRELQGVIERAAILGGGKNLLVEQALTIQHSALEHVTQSAESQVKRNNTENEFRKLDEVVIEHIKTALTKSYGRIEGPFGAAKLLGLNPNTLRSKMKKFGLSKQLVN